MEEFSQRHPLKSAVRLFTRKGLAMQIQLMMGLIDLTCPVNESCSLLITDSSDSPGIAVLLKRERFVPTKRPWFMNHNPESGIYFYNALFETESAPQIVEAIKELLEIPAAE